nr:hypothetical protein Iba_chr06cCG4210 [Ipomoea batatas]
MMSSRALPYWYGTGGSIRRTSYTTDFVSFIFSSAVKALNPARKTKLWRASSLSTPFFSASSRTEVADAAELFVARFHGEKRPRKCVEDFAPPSPSSVSDGFLLQNNRKTNSNDTASLAGLNPAFPFSETWVSRLSKRLPRQLRNNGINLVLSLAKTDKKNAFSVSCRGSEVSRNAQGR